jgi:hypothetical protein
MPLMSFAEGGGGASPRIHVPGLRAHPPSAQTVVHLTNRHYGAVSGQDDLVSVARFIADCFDHFQREREKITSVPAT